jgi:ferrochelatase
MSKVGLLLVNLGTPDAPETDAVRRYLAEFLSDPRVLDMHPAGRWLLLHGAILRTRPAKSAEAYRKIWSERGSPLLVHSQDLTAAVQAQLGEGWHVALAMRYGAPSIRTGLAELHRAGCDRVVAFPLYPQYSSAATGSSVEKIFGELGGEWVTPEVDVLGAFPDHPAFIRAFAEVARPVLDAERPDHVLLSYHGLPERHCRKAAAHDSPCTRDPACCDTIRSDNRHCYRAQCMATSRALVAALGLTEGSYSISFQSRLGKDPWVKPYTDVVVPELARAGKQRVVVLCPAFVADCLETLEEIGLRAAADFEAAGGERLTLVPSLNATPAWVDAVVDMVRTHTGVP